MADEKKLMVPTTQMVGELYVSAAAWRNRVIELEHQVVDYMTQLKAAQDANNELNEEIGRLNVDIEQRTDEVVKTRTDRCNEQLKDAPDHLTKNYLGTNVVMSEEQWQHLCEAARRPGRLGDRDHPAVQDLANDLVDMHLPYRPILTSKEWEELCGVVGMPCDASVSEVISEVRRLSELAMGEDDV